MTLVWKSKSLKTSDISKRTKKPEAKVPTKSNFESLESYKKRKKWLHWQAKSPGHDL